MSQTLDARTTVRDGGLEREILTLAAVVVLGTIMTVLDLTIVNVAIPTLGRELATSIAAIQWVMTGYMLAFASVIPLAGWASERFGAKRVWIAALLVFVAGSALCGLAWSIGSLIAFRVLQGLGAGMILPVGQTMLAQAAGPQRMGRVMSLIGVPMLLAPVLGPVLGGVIVEEESWRWIFFLNLPVGVAAIVAARRLLPEARPQLGQRLDLRGLALLTPGIALFLYGVSEAGSAGGFANAGTLAAAALGLALVAAFVRHARVRGRAALIDVSLFARRRFATAATVNALLPAALFGTLLLIPLYYQLVRHESPLRIGLLLVPQGIGAALAMPLAGYLTTYADLAAALFVLGIGAGSTIMPSMAAAFQALAREETPRATSALNVIQRTAGAIGTALLAIVLQRAIAADFPGGQEGIQALAARSSGETAGAAGAITDAFATTFWVAAALIALALVPAMLLPRTRAHARPENASPARGVSA
jgi:MFS family permease